MKELPELFDVRVQARSLAYLFAVGAALGVLTLAFPHAESVDDVPLLVLAAIAVATAAAVWLWAERMREWQVHVVVVLGTIILSFANYYTGTTLIYPLLYTWTALYAFYFFHLRAALAHMALIAVSYAVVLLIQEPDSPVVRWLLAVGTPLVAGLLIERLLDRLRAEVRRAGARARELQRSEARTRLVLDSAPDAFVAVDPDGLVTAWNSTAERLFGWSASEAVGMPLRNLIFPESERDAFDERRRSLVNASEAVTVMRMESELQRRDGSAFPAERTISRVRIGDEMVMTAFIRDIGDRRRAQLERDALLREQAARAEAERMAGLVRGMQELVDVALRHTTLDALLSNLLAHVRLVLEADAVTIFFAEDGERLVLGASSPDPDDGEAVLAFGEGFAGRVASAREALLEDNPSLAAHPAVRNLDVTSVIGVPLLVEGDLTGVLVVYAGAPRRFTGEDRTMLRLAADRVALALMHAQIYDREHRIAETLQRSLLPGKLPSLPGFDVAAAYRPAAAEAEVGGDWYDVIPLAGGTVGVVMGDVAGKGLEAASMVGRLRSALRAYALEGHGPSTVVEQLNRLVWNEAEEAQMATLLYAVVDPAASRLRWVNAGHLAPLLVVGDGLTHFVEGGGSVPLGVLPFPTYEEMSVRMEPGTSLVLYTDGLVERPGEHIDEGMARLAERVREVPDDPQALCDHLLESLVPPVGAQDDVALLALRNLPVPDRFTLEFPTEPETLAAIRSLLRRWLRQTGGDEDEIAEITTACGEAATNAIEHAGAAGRTPFVVEGRLDGDEVEITVRDHGAWRPPRSGDQGRGLSLMRALMDTVEVTPSPDGTTVRLLRRLGGNGGSG